MNARTSIGGWRSLEEDELREARTVALDAPEQFFFRPARENFELQTVGRTVCRQ
jgi:hypothetical protein